MQSKINVYYKMTEEGSNRANFCNIDYEEDK